MKKIMLVLVALILCVPMSAYSKKGGNPSDTLQQQIDELRLQIEEIQLIPGPPGPQGEQGIQGEQGPPGAIDVYDANGQYLGILVNTDNGVNTTFYIPSVYSTLTLNNLEGSVGAIGFTVNLLFENDDCTGQPYVPIQMQLMIFVNGSKFYKASATPPVVNFGYNSYRSTGGDCSVYTDTTTSIAAEEVTLPFTLPVALPLGFEN